MQRADGFPFLLQVVIEKSSSLLCFCVVDLSQTRELEYLSAENFISQTCNEVSVVHTRNGTYQLLRHCCSFRERGGGFDSRELSTCQML